MNNARPLIETLLNQDRAALLEEWLGGQLASPDVRTDLLSSNELRVESERFLDALAAAVAADDATADISAPAWSDVREMLGELSRSRAIQGFTPTETATFVLSLKQPFFDRVQRALDGRADELGAALLIASELLDRLGLVTTEAFIRSREDVIRRQQDELIELSTPVVKLWEGVVAVPLIGTLDSARTQVVMESLLERIVETDSTIAVIDITGVPTVDTLVAQHLLKTVAAARLMGADCIISGIRPQIAQTIVHLGLDLSEVTTKASLADAVIVALERTGFEITRRRTAGA
jgi:rsbT co-antagonist protein RsbR